MNQEEEKNVQRHELFHTLFEWGYYGPIIDSIHCGNNEHIEYALSIGMNPDWTSKSRPFLYHAIESNQPHIISLLLSYGATVTTHMFENENENDKNSDDNEIHHHTTVLMELMDSNGFDQESLLHITAKLLTAYSDDPIQQKEFIMQECSCGETAYSLLLDSTYLAIGIQLELLYLYCTIGVPISSLDAQSIWENSIHTSYEPLLCYLLQHNSIHVSEHDVSLLMTPHYTKKVYEEQFTIISKQTMIDILHHVTIDGDSMYVDTKGNTLVHHAVIMGDYDVLCTVLEHPLVHRRVETRNHDGDTPLELAIKQGIVLHALLLLQKSMLQRKTCMTTEKEMKDAHEMFYSHMTREIERCVFRLDPTSDTDSLMEMVRRLVKDLYHPSGIGFPDEMVHHYSEIMMLRSEEEIDQTIMEWSKTNPLAAMRWKYVHHNNVIFKLFE